MTAERAPTKARIFFRPRLVREPSDPPRRVFRAGAGGIAVRVAEAIGWLDFVDEGIVRQFLDTGRKPVHSAETRLWFEFLAFFLPRSIREPFLGDLLEDRDEMLSHGFSRFVIETATLSQIALLLVSSTTRLIRGSWSSLWRS